MVASSLLNMVVAKSLYQQPAPYYTLDHKTFKDNHMLKKEARCLRKSSNEHLLAEVVNPHCHKHNRPIKR